MTNNSLKPNNKAYYRIFLLRKTNYVSANKKHKTLRKYSFGKNSKQNRFQFIFCFKKKTFSTQSFA